MLFKCIRQEVAHRQRKYGGRKREGIKQEKQSKIIMFLLQSLSEELYHRGREMQAQTQSSLKSIIGQALSRHGSSTSWTGNSVLHRCPIGTGRWTARTQHLHISAHMLLPPHKLCPKRIPAAHLAQLCLCSQMRCDPVPPVLVLQTARERKKMSWHGFSNSSLADHLLASFQ